MTDIWQDYSALKQNSTLAERYYAFVSACFDEGVKRVAGTERFNHALDIACGAGDNTAVLGNYARSVTGIDFSIAQIEKAKSNPSLAGIRFLHGDFLTYTPETSFDLITAAWFHNFIHDAEAQQQTAKRIADALVDSGAIVFLFPSDSFTSAKTQAYANLLTWRQAWLDSEARCSRGVFSFQGSPWATMTCWQPLFLFEQYHPYFELHFLDTKKICVERGYMDKEYLNPTFEVMYGFKREL